MFKRKYIAAAVSTEGLLSIPELI